MTQPFSDSVIEALGKIVDDDDAPNYIVMVEIS